MIRAFKRQEKTMMNVHKKLFLAPRFENIPAGLRELPWAVWIAEPRAGKPGKFDKAPRSPETGNKIGTNKPHLFGTFDQAMASYEAGGYTGVGVLLTGDGLIGVDIDDVDQTVTDKPEVESWINATLKANAYCEYSPSNTGLRLFMLGDPLPDTVGRKHGHLEIYDDVRFLTVTGHLVPNGGDHA
jgi:primase-polymerase (primpol)-like protein